MKKYKYLLFDLDNTILSFDKAEWAALGSLFQIYGFGEFTKERLERYHEINHRYWADIEAGRIEKSVALVERFVEFFGVEGLQIERATDFNRDYQLALGDTVEYCDNGKELLDALKGKYILVAVTNGTKLTQDKKLSKSKLDQVFDHVFISEEVGFDKPDIRFFENVKQVLGIVDFEECILIGDSLNSDIKGGNNAKIRSIWYNPSGQENRSDAIPDIEIRHLDEIRKYIHI